MTRMWCSITSTAIALSLGLAVGGCTAKGQAQEDEGAPPPADVVRDEGASGVATVDHPEAFPLVAAEAYESRPALRVTGVVTVDSTRAVPVWSLVSGRVVDMRARLGDTVRAGQVLLRIHSTEIADAFSNYRHAVADDELARTQLQRAKELYERGAIPKKDLEVAQDTADKATVDVETTREDLRVLGVDPTRAPTGNIDVVAPVSGVVTEQNVTPAAGIKSISDADHLFTISDLSRVWIVCDVYENDLPNVDVGDEAEVRLNAYPDRVVTGRVSNILPILDSNIRTGKVRIEVANPGFMRVGMFVTATFQGQNMEMHTVVPASAVLRLHDRDWVYVPAPGNAFRRLEVTSGDAAPGDKLEVRAGLKVGDKVVANSLLLDRAIGQ